MKQFIFIALLSLVGCGNVQLEFKYGDVVAIKSDCIPDYIITLYKFKSYDLIEFNNARIFSYNINIFNNVEYGVEVQHSMVFLAQDCIIRNN